MSAATEKTHSYVNVRLSETAFHRLAWWTVGWLILIIATGATVRLTGSGLGCHHWPGCTPNAFLPEQGFHSDVEFGNRVVAAFTVFATLVLGLCVVIAVRGHGFSLPVRARQLASLLLAAVTFLVVTGTLATASGKFPGSNAGTPVRRIGMFQPAVALHVKAVAIFGASFLLLAFWAWRNHVKWLLVAGGGLLAILAGQMVVGEFQYRMYGAIPWWVVLIHVALAASLFAWTVGLVARVWYPARN